MVSINDKRGNIYRIDCSDSNGNLLKTEAGSIYDPFGIKIGTLKWQSGGNVAGKYALLDLNGQALGTLERKPDLNGQNDCVRFRGANGTYVDIPCSAFSGTEEVISQNLLGRYAKPSHQSREQKRSARRGGSGGGGSGGEPSGSSGGTISGEAASGALTALLVAAVVISLLFLFLSHNSDTVIVVARSTIGMLFAPIAAIWILLIRRKSPAGFFAKMVTVFCYLSLQLYFLFYTDPELTGSASLAFKLFLLAWLPKLVYSIIAGIVVRNKRKHMETEAAQAIGRLHLSVSIIYPIVCGLMEFVNMFASTFIGNIFEALAYSIPSIILVGIVVTLLSFLTGLPFRFGNR